MAEIYAANVLVSPKQFAEWCVEVERIHEASFTTPACEYTKTYRQALAESSVPEEWQEVIGLLVWRETYCELWDWCQDQGVDPSSSYKAAFE